MNVNTNLQVGKNFIFIFWYSEDPQLAEWNLPSAFGGLTFEVTANPIEEVTIDDLDGFTEEPIGFTDEMFTVETATDDMFTDDPPIEECLFFENRYCVEFMQKLDNSE